MAVQRQTGRARAMKPAMSKVSAGASKVPDHEADDSETLTDRA